MHNLECLDGYYKEDCEGDIKYRDALSGTGYSFPRCERHWDMRVQAQDEINRRYPKQQPADFDPMYAGERWDEDY
jgi:hypothetical protein